MPRARSPGSPQQRRKRAIKSQRRKTGFRADGRKIVKSSEKKIALNETLPKYIRKQSATYWSEARLMELAAPKPEGYGTGMCGIKEHRFGGFAFITGISTGRKNKIGYWQRACFDTENHHCCRRPVTEPIPYHVVQSDPELVHALQVRDDLNNLVDTPSPPPTPPAIPAPDRATTSVRSSTSRVASTSTSGSSISAKFKALGSAVSIATSPAFSEKSKASTATSTSMSMYSYSSDSDDSVNSLGPNIRKFETRAYTRGRARRSSVISSHRFASPPSVGDDVVMDNDTDDEVEVTGFWQYGEPVFVKTPERVFSHLAASNPRVSRSSYKRRPVFYPNITDLTISDSEGLGAKEKATELEKSVPMKTINVNIFSGADGAPLEVDFKTQVRDRFFLSDYSRSLPSVGLIEGADIYLIEVGDDTFNPVWKRVGWNERLKVQRGSLLVLKINDNTPTPFDTQA